ncbi:MAG TPA: hypothetical protein VHD87_15305 [Acidimicrobiales bacterium]|nr:hypothetical protein [Acidimicrobiales bacterium]
MLIAVPGRWARFGRARRAQRRIVAAAYRLDEPVPVPSIVRLAYWWRLAPSEHADLFAALLAGDHLEDTQLVHAARLVTQPGVHR